jgi:hypothetical protein
MSARYLLCIDPGLLTGMALLDMSEQENPIVLGSGEYGVRDFYNKAEELIARLSPDMVVVVENFIITTATAKKTSAPWSLRGVGVVEFLCLKYGATMELQTPDQAKEIPSSDLKIVEFWHVGGEGHANDAFRHAVVYLKDRHRRWARAFL